MTESPTTQTTPEAETASETETETGTETETDHAEQTTGTPLETCPECDGDLEPDAEHGEQVCTECGLVVDDDAIDRGPDWRAHTQDERDEKSRVGAPTSELYHDKGLSTNIGWQNKDAFGNSLSTQQRQKVQRLRTWNERYRTRNPKERNLRQALGEIDRMASALRLPGSVRETAGVIYRRALEDDLIRGRSIEGVSSAAVYTAARQASTPRTIDEILSVSRIERQELMHTYRYLLHELNLEVAPADPREYLPRFASDLDAADEIEYRARELLDTAISEEITSGKSPVGLAAAAIYAGALLCGEKIPQRIVSDTTDVTVVTIRNRYQELLALQDDITLS
jgi:transcription initiation factor TFIIB